MGDKAQVLHGHITEIKKIRSQMVCRVSIEVPIEAFKQTVQFLDDERVIVAKAGPALKNVPYGVVVSGEILEQPRLDAPKPEQGDSELARNMMAKGYFLSHKLWNCMEEHKVWTQKQHKALVEAMPCLGENQRFFDNSNTPLTFCDGDVVLHHVRSSADAGMGYKPPHWYGVPLCGAHHVPVAHDKNTAHLRAYLMEQAMKITGDAMKRAVKDFLGLGSLKELDREMLAEFEEHIGYTGQSGI